MGWISVAALRGNGYGDHGGTFGGENFHALTWELLRINIYDQAVFEGLLIVTVKDSISLSRMLAGSVSCFYFFTICGHSCLAQAPLMLIEKLINNDDPGFVG